MEKSRVIGDPREEEYCSTSKESGWTKYLFSSENSSEKDYVKEIRAERSRSRREGHCRGGGKNNNNSSDQDDDNDSLLSDASSGLTRRKNLRKKNVNVEMETKDFVLEQGKEGWDESTGECSSVGFGMVVVRGKNLYLEEEIDRHK